MVNTQGKTVEKRKILRMENRSDESSNFITDSDQRFIFAEERIYLLNSTSLPDSGETYFTDANLPHKTRIVWRCVFNGHI